MPGFDRTGPMGQGPRTSGGFGYCGASAGAGLFGGFGFAGGYGCGRRSRRAFGGEFGYGRRPGSRGEGYYPGVSPRVSRKEERDCFKDQIAQLKADLEVMENRVAALGPDQVGKAET